MQKSSKRTVEDYLSIDSRSMHKSNVLTHGAFGTWGWRNQNGDVTASMGHQCVQDTLILSFCSDGKSYEQRIKINSTPCNYGNQRYWFICPKAECGKRVAKLYLVDCIFYCRHCHKLNYLIQQCNKNKVAHLNMQRMRLRLGWPLDREVPFLKKVYKPLNKNLKTFKAMVAKHDAYETEANAIKVSSFKMFLKSLGETDSFTS